MKKLLLLIALAMLILAGVAAPAVHAAPAAPALTVTCATLTLQYWTAGDTHDGHNVQQALKPHASSVFGAWQDIWQSSGVGHSHTFYAKRPQAYEVKYRVSSYDGSGETWSNEWTCNPSITFAAGAESDISVSSGSSNDGEWAKNSIENGGYGQVVRSKPSYPVLKGIKSYECSAQTHTSTSNDRCELAVANASQANIAPDNVWGTGDDIWYALAFRLSDGWPTLGSGSYDGGAISQEKQAGECGRPINSLAIEGSASGQLYLAQHNDDKTGCSYSGGSWTLWKVPVQDETWIRVLRHYKFSPDANVGFVESYVDTDGDSLIDWTPVNDLEPDGDALAYTQPARPTDIGTVDTSTGNAKRIKTWTAKNDPNEVTVNPVYCPNPGKWPCVHARVGIYRDGDIVGNATVWHDSVVSGPDSGDVVDAAF